MVAQKYSSPFIFSWHHSLSGNMNFLNSYHSVRDTAHHKVLGTIIGSALGDTIGLYTEFLPAAAAETVYPTRRFTLSPTPTPFYADGHRDRFSSAAWTDDTDHALLLVLAYLHNKGDLDTLPRDFASRLAIWAVQGLRCLDRPPLGIGKTIGLVVCDSKFPSSPEKVALAQWIRLGKRPAANGSLMRSHPLGLMAVPLPLDETFDLAARISKTTHPDPRCVVACCAAVAIVRGIVRGEVRREVDVDGLLEQAFEYVAARSDLYNPEREDGMRDHESSVELLHENKEVLAVDRLLDHEEFSKHVHAQSFQDLQLDDAMTMGYVYKCLGSAVIALRQVIRLTGHTMVTPTKPFTSPKNLQSADPRDWTNELPFEQIITELTMSGGDADTNCCVAGAFVGAWVGYDGLPLHYREGLSHRDWLKAKTEKLSRRIGILENCEKVELTDSDTAPDGGKPLMTQEELERRDMKFVEDMLCRAAQRRGKDDPRKENPRGLVGWIKTAVRGRPA
jgi:ADP-ribosylglycohydrolase